MTTTTMLLRPTAIALALAAACGTAAAQGEKDLAQEVQQLRDELRQMRQELDALRRQAPAAAAPAPTQDSTPSWARETAPAAGAAPIAGNAPAATATAAAVPGASSGTGLSFFGYGELSYDRPRRDAANTVATAGRGVFGFAYRFDDRTRMAAELEVENAVASAGDRGEVAFEQLYIEHDLTPSLSARTGLFLMPVGYINETHEPTRYFGVHRNLVETAIIPSTWRELGVGLRGTTDAGLRWDAGLVTGFDLTKWDPTGTEGRDSPLASIHQEGQLAKARTLAGYGAVNYNGIPGWNFGGSVYRGGAGQKQPDFAGADATVSLAEAHMRWQPGRWDLSALAATGRFGGVSALNATFAGQPTPIPDRFGGWYAQAAYRAWEQGGRALWPFARYERLNTASAYSGLPQGLAPGIQPDTRVVTVGASYYLHPQVVVKADYMRFLSDSLRDRLNLGVGFHF